MEEATSTSRSRANGVGRPAVYPRLRRQMLELVEASGLKPGDALESEMALCRRFGVSRPLVRRVLVELGTEGLIRSVPGKGHFLADPEGVAASKSGVVVYVTGSTRPEFMGPDAHIMGIMEGLGQALHESAYRLLWENRGSRHREMAEMVGPHLSELRGMVLAPLSDQSVPRMLEAVPAKVKCVVAGRPSGLDATPCVYVDQYEGMQRGASYLTGLGHRHIGYIELAERSWTMLLRRQAYEAVMAAAGLAPIIAQAKEEPEHAEQVVTGMLREHKEMTAVITAAGSLLPWVLRAMQIKGMRLPHDLSLLSFDDTPISRQHYPAITVVRQPIGQMGSIAGKMMLELLEGRIPPRAEVALKCELVVRDSARSVNG